MVQLFRKIRQKLLTEKKISQYFTYAIGEILLVLIGILLAIQFNNWSVEKGNKVKERWYLINMVEDIEYQRQILESQKIHYQETIETAKSILRDYKKTGKIGEIDSLNEKLNLFMEVNIFPNINNTYQELVSSGQQAIIKDKDLSIGVIDYYLFCEDNYKDVKNNNDNVYYRELHPLFYNNSQITILKNDDLISDKEGLFDTDDEITNFLKNKLDEQETKIKFLNALKALIILNNIHLDLVKETIDLGIELVKVIDLYLGFTPEMVNEFKFAK
ncbi:DUF6090 family protein [Polaribacter sp.]|uniref:DUF6090 family protein n=1 Tax=Polaribacter sp. TaxID=1920175 RepID=UPI0040476339